MDSCAEGVETHDDLHLIRELGVSMVQGFIFGRPADAAATRELANQARVEPIGFRCIREPRHRLMRRAVTCVGGTTLEVRLRNISSTGALVECEIPVTPGDELVIDIVGVGPMQGSVRWSQARLFGLRFTEPFDLTRLAHKRETVNKVTMLRPDFFDQREAG
jgi:hypothetical protein